MNRPGSTLHAIGMIGLLAGPVVAAPASPAPSPDAGFTRRSELRVIEAAGSTPLLLDWRPVVPGTEVCVLDGVRLRAGADYEIDWERGLLKLRRPVSAGAVLSVLYSTAAGLEHWNRGVPVDASLLGASPVAGKTGPSPQDRLRAGLESGLSWAALAPAAGLSRSSLREQLLTGLRRTEFTHQVDGGPGAGSAFVTYNRADALDPLQALDTREEVRARVQLHPGIATRLLLDSSLTRESLFSDSFEETERRRLQIEQTWGKSVVGLLWERQRTDGAGFANALDAFSLSLTHPVSSRLTAEALLGYEDSLARGRSTRGLISLRERFADWLEGQATLYHRVSAFEGANLESALNLLFQPGHGIRARAGYRAAHSERYGSYSSLSAEAEASLGNRVRFLGEYTERHTEALGAIRSFGLGMSARPTSTSILEAAFSESVGRDIGREQSRTLRLALEPTSAVRFQLGYDLLTGSRDRRSEHALWGLTLGERQYVRLEGYRALRELRDRDPFEDSLYRVEVRPLEFLGFSGSLRQIGDEAGRRSVAGLGAHLRLLSLLELEAGYRKPTLPDPSRPGLSGQDLRLSLGPGPAFRIFGEYRDRPDDEFGSLLDETHRSLGLETRLGFLGLQGSLTRENSILTLDEVERADLLASIHLGRSTRLYGGVRTLSSDQLGAVRSEILRFGIAQTSGPNLFLMLEGQIGYLRDLAGGGLVRNPEDTRAQARIGARF